MEKHKVTFVKKIVTSKFWLFLALLIVFFIMYSSFSLFLKRNNVFKKVNSLRREESMLIERKEKLIDKNNLIESEFGKEIILRERFNVSKPDEEVIFITKTGTNISIEERTGFVNKIRGMFKK
jgi:hypothetical protein